MAKKMKIRMICERCGNMQESDKKQQSKNWEVYPNVPCWCGGKYKPTIEEDDVLIEFVDWLQNAYSMGMSSSAINDWEDEIKWFKKVLKKAGKK